MKRPRIFISAVSEELKTARQGVAAVVRRMGFDAVSQDDFPTGHGELRQWLRDQIDTCEGLIQLVGEGYGAEPLEIDPDYDRVSYTQFEFLYASLHRKKTWFIGVSPECERDTPVEQLDLPRDQDHPDPQRYQAERRALQQDYIERLRSENHLRHYAHSLVELENKVSNIRHSLDELIARHEKQQRTQSKTLFAVLALVVVILLGGGLAYNQLTGNIEDASQVTNAKIRAQLLTTIEERYRAQVEEVEAISGSAAREQRRSAVEQEYATSLGRVDTIITSISEIISTGQSTQVFQRMQRILGEEGVDAALTYIKVQQPSILDSIRADQEAAEVRIRAKLQPLLQSADLYRTKGEYEEATRLYHEILALQPSWPAALHDAIWFQFALGDREVIYGTLDTAEREYLLAQEYAKTLTAQDSTDSGWQRDLSVSYNKLGNVAVSQGDLTSAATYFTDGLTIARRLADSDPSRADWQRNLSVSYNKLGGVAVSQGNLAAATAYFTDDLNIARRLADSDHTRADWQRDLSVSYDRLGNVAISQGDLTAAATFFTDGLTIRRRLADRDPSRADWQRDLSVSYNKLGNVAVSQGDLKAAATYFSDGLTIARRLADADPTRADWRRDLWVTYWKLASLEEKRNKVEEAAKYWRLAHSVITSMEKEGKYLSPGDQRTLEFLAEKVAEK